MWPGRWDVAGMTLNHSRKSHAEHMARYGGACVVALPVEAAEVEPGFFFGR